MVVVRTAGVLSAPQVAVAAAVVVAGAVAAVATAYVASRPAPTGTPEPAVVASAAPGGSPPAFTITGSLAGMPVPGTTVPISVNLTNPHPFPIVVSGLTVRLDRIAGRGVRRCGPADFVVHQFSGRYGFVLGALRTSTLSHLGLRPPAWPQVAMLDRPVNQDGCKGAHLTLVITGTAVRAAL